jgi:hypothetical protein
VCHWGGARPHHPLAGKGFLEQFCCDDVGLERALSAASISLKKGGSMPERHGEQIVETTTEARQGVTGHNARYVLVWSTGAVIVVFAIVYFVFFR